MAELSKGPKLNVFFNMENWKNGTATLTVIVFWNLLEQGLRNIYTINFFFFFPLVLRKLTVHGFVEPHWSVEVMVSDMYLFSSSRLEIFCDDFRCC